MTVFDIDESLRRAEQRFGGGQDQPRRRKRRSDANQSRLPEEVVERLGTLLLGHERPSMACVLRDLDAYCRSNGYRMPTRATVYKLMARLDGHRYRVAELPEAVRGALYNLTPDTEVPGHQLAFYCFNYGGLEAMSYACGLPWLDLYQAARMRGWRSKSRGLLEAAAKVRGI